MDAMTYTTVRATLASAMDRVCDDHEALIIVLRTMENCRPSYFRWKTTNRWKKPHPSCALPPTPSVSLRPLRN